MPATFEMFLDFLNGNWTGIPPHSNHQMLPSSKTKIYTDKLHLLSRKASSYTKLMMKWFTEILWQESVNNQLQLEGCSQIPKVSTLPLPMPPATSREQEVLIMSLFYKNNLLNTFLFTTERRICPSPLCQCGMEEQTAFHLLSDCDLVELETRDKLVYHLQLGNSVNSAEELAGDHVTILNCSRDKKFIELCRDVVETECLQLQRKIILSTRKKTATKAEPSL